MHLGGDDTAVALAADSCAVAPHLINHVDLTNPGARALNTVTDSNIVNSLCGGKVHHDPALFT